MTGSGAVQCQSPACGKLFYLSPEEWVALDPVLGESRGIQLRCPDCGHVFVYHSDSLVESEVPVHALPGPATAEDSA